MKIYLIDFFHSSSSHLSRTHCANIAGGGYEDRFFTPVHTQHCNTQCDCPYRCTHTDDILRLLNNTTYNQKHAPPKATTTSGTSTSFFFPTQSKNVNPVSIDSRPDPLHSKIHSLDRFPTLVDFVTTSQY